jgi:hypothetical protein
MAPVIVGIGQKADIASLLNTTRAPIARRVALNTEKPSGRRRVGFSSARTAAVEPARDTIRGPRQRHPDATVLADLRGETDASAPAAKVERVQNLTAARSAPPPLSDGGTKHTRGRELLACLTPQAPRPAAGAHAQSVERRVSSARGLRPSVCARAFVL